MRTSAKQLHALADRISEATGHDFTICGAGEPTRWVLQAKAGDGVTDISPWLPAGQLYDWLHAYLAGMDSARKVAWLKSL